MLEEGGITATTLRLTATVPVKAVDDKGAFALYQFAVQAHPCALNFISLMLAIAALWTWRDWRRSRRFTMLAFGLPFVWNMLILSVPPVPFTNFDITAVRKRVEGYTFSQVGFITGIKETHNAEAATQRNAAE